MSARTVFPLANGKYIDLRNPQFEASDLTALAEHIAKEKRFNGGTAGREYSVAEHCCLGSDAILTEAEDEESAAYFLLHDLHEALVKDVTTPLKHAIAEEAEEAFGVLADKILETFDRIEQGLARAIHAAAGLRWPAPEIARARVKHFDKVMFVTEWRDLMGNREHPDWSPYEGIVPLRLDLRSPWAWQVAHRGWMRRAEALLPALQKVPA